MVLENMFEVKIRLHREYYENATRNNIDGDWKWYYENH